MSDDRAGHEARDAGTTLPSGPVDTDEGGGLRRGSTVDGFQGRIRDWPGRTKGAPRNGVTDDREWTRTERCHHRSQVTNWDGKRDRGRGGTVRLRRGRNSG